MGGECEEHNVNWAQRQSDITGPEGSFRHQASASVLHAVLAATSFHSAVKKISSVWFLHLSMLKHTDVKGLVCPSYQRFRGAVSKRHPGLELHSHHLFWLLLWETLPYSFPPFTPSQHSVSLCYPQLLYPQTHTHTQMHSHQHTATDRALSVLPEVNSQIGSNSTDWAEWASLSLRLAFAPRVD